MTKNLLNFRHNKLGCKILSVPDSSLTLTNNHMEYVVKRIKSVEDRET